MRIAAVKLESVWTAIFGTPVVPEVRRIHSERWLSRRSGFTAERLREQVTEQTAPGRLISVVTSETTASISAVAAIAGRYSGARPGGQTTSRRATPSSSISANAAVSWSWVTTNTERPRNSSSRPPRLDPQLRSGIATLPWRSKRKQPEGSLMVFSTTRSRRRAFVNSDEVTKGDGKLDFLRSGKWIEPQLIFEPSDDDRKKERIQT